jgi:phage regulator Rha-like protein
MEQARQERFNFLRERTLRIRIQFELLTRMLQEAEAELAELEKADGNKAEGPLQDQG